MTDYRWIAEPPVTAPDLASDLDLPFPSLAEAEDWLGTVFDDLREVGVARVTLLEDGKPILGPMDLEPSDTEGEPA